MNQLTNGENDSESASDQQPRTTKHNLENLDETLRQIDASLGIDCAETNIDISEYLTMSRREIESLTPEVAASMAHEIRLSTFHIQKTINRNMARLNWCKTTLNKYFGTLSRDYSYIYGWEAQKAAMTADDSYATKLHNRIVEYQSRVDSLFGINATLKDIADSLKNLQYLKTSKDRNNHGY